MIKQHKKHRNIVGNLKHLKVLSKKIIILRNFWITYILIRLLKILLIIIESKMDFNQSMSKHLIHHHYSKKMLLKFME